MDADELTQQVAVNRRMPWQERRAEAEIENSGSTPTRPSAW